MSFKPFSIRYQFDKSILTEDFPDYLADPITDWLYSCLKRHSLTSERASGTFGRTEILETTFKQNLQLDFHRSFKYDIDDFLGEVFEETELLCNVLAYLLQNYCIESQAIRLRGILRKGSSAYTVMWLKEDPTSYDKGVFDIGWFVPTEVKQQAKEALSASELIASAWHACYKRNPNPSLCVSQSVDFMEGFLRDRYYPGTDRTPTIFHYIEKFEKDPTGLSFKGDSFLSDKSRLLALLQGTSRIRAEHTTGDGREATNDEAIYVLHTAVYIWNLMK